MSLDFTQAIPWAQASQAKWKIPASLILSAAAVESSLGAATPAGTNNWFGIKDTHGTVAATKEQTATGEVYTISAGFKVFPTPADGFMYYGQLLGLGTPYHDMVTKFLQSPQAPADVQRLSNALTGVYATAQNYGSALIKIQTEYNLYQYDKVPSAAAPAPTVETTVTTTAPTTAPIAPPIVAPAPAAPTVKQTALDVGDALEVLLKLADVAAEAGTTAAMDLIPGPLKMVVAFFGPTVIQGYIHTAFMQLEASAAGKTVEVNTSNAMVAMTVQALNDNEAYLVRQLTNLEAMVEPMVKAFLAKLTPAA